MKTFTFVKGIVPLLTLALFAVTTSAQTVTLNPSATQNISTGGTVSFTATRSSNSQTWPGGNGQFTYTWSSSPAGVTFTNNPNTTSNSSSGTVATFPSNGTYQITCFVQEGGGLNATSAATTVNVTAPLPSQSLGHFFKWHTDLCFRSFKWQLPERAKQYFPCQFPRHNNRWNIHSCFRQKCFTQRSSRTFLLATQYRQ
ncbi:MAG: hypothetical protein IPQ25_17225 [Chitinophagaceae bacterium]|nr:hypothetical protein [Chitinophagaceae bacterium]